MRLPVKRYRPLSFLLLVSCAAAAVAAPDGPRAGAGTDLPVVLGEPFSIDGVAYVPADTAQYDHVGSALVDAEGGNAVSASHRTLPLPSYVEVTSLQSGRTILVRVERRGPMDNTHLIALSPAAAAQLGETAGPMNVRVRRVSPPDAERALLRTGQTAPARLDAPAGLLAALRRKLALQGTAKAPALPATLAAVPTPAPDAAVAAPVATKVQTAVAPPPKPAPAPEATKAGSKSGFVVQLAAFSTRERAAAAAAKVGGSVEPAGKFWRLRLGPFADRGKAAAALAKARSAGYSDARIQHVA